MLVFLSLLIGGGAVQCGHARREWLIFLHFLTGFSVVVVCCLLFDGRRMGESSTSTPRSEARLRALRFEKVRLCERRMKEGWEHLMSWLISLHPVPFPLTMFRQYFAPSASPILTSPAPAAIEVELAFSLLLVFVYYIHLNFFDPEKKKSAFTDLISKKGAR
jgi:hypothetical protein